MNKKGLEIELKSPNVEEYRWLRQEVGWGDISQIMAETGLKNSLYHITIRSNENLVAMARIIGDGTLYFYIQDVMVHPSHQRRGLGKLLMEGVEAYLNKKTRSGSTVGLLAAQGMERFYARFGYVKRTGNPLGKGMCKFI